MYNFALIYTLLLIFLNKKILFSAFLGLLFLLSGCTKNETSGPTWISGEIVNPTSDYVVFAQGDRIIDTVKLDSNNFFRYKSTDLKEGLYILRHNETQVFYISPGDSLMIHLNTVDFDESLAYSGRGAQKNNLLMELFLLNEQENINLPKWYQLTPREFQSKIDSLKALKETIYQDFHQHSPMPDLFEKAVHASISYDNYMKKELYVLANSGRNAGFPKYFLQHRAEADLNQENLRFYYPYYRFLIYYLDNLTIEKTGSNQNRFTFDFSNSRLKIIDSLIQNDSIRNNLSRNTALRFYFNGKENKEKLKSFLDNFKQINNSKKHRNEVERIAAIAANMSAGETIPNIPLLTADNSSKELHELIAKPTVLFFWSYHSPTQATSNHNRAGELKSKYPEYNFYGINTDDHFRQWRNYLQKQNYSEDHEFQLENPIDSEHSLLLNNLSKAIIIDKNLKILDGNNSMFNQNFEELLLGFLNRTE